MGIRHLTQTPLPSQQISALTGRGNLHLITQHFPKNIVAFNSATKPPAPRLLFCRSTRRRLGLSPPWSSSHPIYTNLGRILPFLLPSPSMLFSYREDVLCPASHSGSPTKPKPPAEPARVAAEADAETSSGSSRTPPTAGCPPSAALHWKQLDAFGWSYAPAALRSRILRARKPPCKHST